MHSDKQNQAQHTPISASAWLRIGQLFEAALARPLEERASYLEKNCSEEPEICWEVLSLLKSAETAGSFLDNPATVWSAQRLTLEHGYKLGQFEILEVIGRGGMGDVYRARDLRLQREVALKVLPQAFACDPERVLRFEREAKAAGSLSHPNVVHIYEVGRTDGNWWIASEFVQGCSLDRVTERGAIAWRRAVEIATQIAHGLAAAHAAGVIHRDLTPRNIMVTPEGGIKILDFGTAKLDYAISAATGSFAAEISGTGLIIGTPGYMAPEQVAGRTADARSDIFALGVVLYEMLSGLRAFKSSSAIETMSATLKEEPPDLPGSIPAPVRRITRRCLDKAANQRFQSAADVGFALAALLGEDVDVNDVPAVPAKHRVSPKWIILAGTVAILIMGASYWASTRANKPAAPPELVLRRLTLDSGLTTDGAISPDGKLVAFASDRGNANNLNIWVKQLDGAGAAVRLTNNAADDHDPAFSPDGTQIAYRSELEGGGIYAIPSVGGEPHLLVPQGKRPRFSPDGRFLLYWKGIGSRKKPFGEFGVSLFAQAAAGGTPIQIGSSCGWINALALWSPDSRRVLFEGICDQQLDIWTFSIADNHLQPSHGLFKYLLDNGFRSPASAYQYPAFVFQEWATDPARLFMLRFTGDTISSAVVPISADGSRVTGRLQKLTFGADDQCRISVASNARVVLSSFAATPQVWALPIDDEARSAGDPQQLTFDGSGTPSLSRDGHMVAVRSSRADAWELHSIDLVTRKQTVIATGPGGIGSHLLSRLGDTIFYVVMHDQKFRLFQASISSGLPRELREGRFLLGDVSSSGRVLLGTPYSNWHGIAAFDIQSREEREVLVDPGRRWLWAGTLSSDGRWLSFNAVWPGHSQIYIAPFRGALVPQSEWIAITDGSSLDGNPGFSHQDQFLFFASDRDGRRCIWAERLSLDMRPLGQPFPVQHFHSSRRSIADPAFGLRAGPKTIVLDESELTGNLLLLEAARKP